MLSRLLKRYKEKYIFECEEDKEIIGRRNVKSMIWILSVVLIFSIVGYLCFIFRHLNKENFFIRSFLYYASMFFISLSGIICSIFFLKRKAQYKKILLLKYAVIISSSLLGLYFVAECKFPLDGLLFFSIEVLLSIVFFDVNPIYWAVVIFISDISIFFITAEILDFGTFVNFVILSIIVVCLGFWRRSSTVKDLKQTRALVLANKKSEELLLNMLPKKVMEDLRETGKSTPEQYKNVSILFTDIVDFTETAKNLEPSVLINELNEIFGSFDLIVDKYNCTRIKTIGDAYLAVCGLPESDPDHAVNLMNCAKEFIAFLEKRNETSEIKWKMRIGIHTGDVIAGIVDIRKYIYDIFGDAVNIASRVENLGGAMKINISEDTYKQLQGCDLHFTTREIMDVKGKGKMQMYFVE